MADQAAPKRVNVAVSGMVQGVFFRASIEEQARRRGVTGWVRNRADGQVEAEFQGADGAVDALVDFCRDGPPQARVERVDVTAIDPVDGEQGFDVR